MPDGHVHVCYEFVIMERQVTWLEAREECLRRDKDLISIVDVNEKEYIHNWFLHIDFDEDDQNIYIGEGNVFRGIPNENVVPRIKNHIEQI